MQSVRDRIVGNKFLRSLALLAGSTVLGQAINLLVTPILTRLYSPSDLGILGLVVAFTSIAAVAVTLKFELAIVSATTDTEARDLMLGSIVLATVLSVLSCVVFWGLHQQKLLGFHNVPLWAIPLVLVITLALASTGIFKYWFTRKEDFKIVGQMNLLQNISKAAAQVGLFFWSGFGLMVGEALGRCAGLLSGWKKSGVFEHFVAWRKQQITPMNTLYKYKNFPLFVLPSSFLDILGVMLPLPIVAGLYGVSAAGEMAMAQRVISIPIALVGGSLADVFHAQISGLQRENPEKIASTFLRMALVLFGVGVVPALLFWFFGQDIFRLVFGEKWQNTGILVAMMTPWMLAQFVVSPISRLILLTQKQYQKLVFDALALLLVVLVPSLTHQMNFSVAQTLWWLSLGLVSAYLIYFGILWRLALELSRKEG